MIHRAANNQHNYRRLSQGGMPGDVAHSFRFYVRTVTGSFAKTAYSERILRDQGYDNAIPFPITSCGAAPRSKLKPKGDLEWQVPDHVGCVPERQRRVVFTAGIGPA